MIDVQEMMARVSVDELNERADAYFRKVWKEAALSKPFVDIGEAPEVLATFFHVLKGLAVPKGGKILDFGAGTCWSTRLLASFGYEAIAVDVSETALNLGRELMATHRVLVEHIEPKFLRYDGYRLPLEDNSVDGVMCLSALHHVPNPVCLISELYRVLRPLGIAGCSEPGPNHSKSLQAQQEMADYGVIENDIVIEEVWAEAKRVGFSQILLGVFFPDAYVTTLTNFSEFLGGGRLVELESRVRSLMQERRLFFLEKGPQGGSDSSNASGLAATLSAIPNSTIVRIGSPLEISFCAVNVGAATWRPFDSLVGPVRLGFQIARLGEDFQDRDRLPLCRETRLFVTPGERISGVVRLNLPREAGAYRVKLQLVSEMVAWFGPAVMIDVSVVTSSEG